MRRSPAESGPVRRRLVVRAGWLSGLAGYGPARWSSRRIGRRVQAESVRASCRQHGRGTHEESKTPARARRHPQTAAAGRADRPRRLLAAGWTAPGAGGARLVWGTGRACAGVGAGSYKRGGTQGRGSSSRVRRGVGVWGLGWYRPRWGAKCPCGFPEKSAGGGGGAVRPCGIIRPDNTRGVGRVIDKPRNNLRATA